MIASQAHRLTAILNTAGLSAATASAAFLPSGGAAFAQGAAPNWTGVYVGGQFGWQGTRATTHNYFFLSGKNGFNQTLNQNRNRPNGPAFGVYYGYNRQFGSLVAGVEGDINARFGSSNSTLAIPVLGKLNGLGGGGFAAALRVKTEWETSLRARLGFLATDRLLIFGTAGVSWADFTFSNPGGIPGFPPGASQAITQLSGLRNGFVVGGGFEYAINENLHAKIEALHTIYRSKKTSYSGAGGEDTYLASFRSKIKSTTIRIGISHRFGTGGGSSLP